MPVGRSTVSASQAPAAIGPYSQAVLIDLQSTAGLLFCSGQIPLHPQTGELACEDVAGQTRRCLESLEAICEEAGADLSLAARLTIYTTDLSSFAEINQAYKEFFGADPPARVTIGVAELPKGARVEIDAIVPAPAGIAAQVSCPTGPRSLESPSIAHPLAAPPCRIPHDKPFTPGALQTMAVASQHIEKTDEQKAITEMVRQFADEQIIPNAGHYDHEDVFPGPIVEQMKELGLFGVTIPEEYGGMGLDLTTYAMIVEELSRGWISISGVINTHFIGSYLLMKFGSEEQKQKYLPRMATGEIRAAFSLSEPELGSDVQAIKTSAKKVADAYEINGQKMWVTNGLMSSLVFVLVKTDPDADPRHKGFTCFIAEKEGGVSENTGAYKGLKVPPKIKKLGYKGVESTELVFDGYMCPAENILGGEGAGLNKGFSQMMDALEVGRVNVAARGVGIAQRALELALRYSQERKTFGKPISEHQAIQFKLADMATQVEAARLLTIRAARLKDAGERSDLEAGMAKLFASEAGRFCVEESFRIHGGYGYSKEYEIERLYRDAPLLLIGEGTSEIQRMVIGRKLLQRNKI